MDVKHALELMVVDADSNFEAEVITAGALAGAAIGIYCTHKLAKKACNKLIGYFMER